MADDPYGRVTNPARFLILHETADALLDDLESRYLVARSRGRGLDGGLEDGLDIVRVERLTPMNIDEAPLTMVFSDSPGLNVRFGRWYTDLIPLCGCDGCDDDAESLAENLALRVEALVAGRFSEGHDWYKFRYAGPVPGGEWGGLDDRSVEEADDHLREPPEQDGSRGRADLGQLTNPVNFAHSTRYDRALTAA